MDMSFPAHRSPFAPLVVCLFVALLFDGSAQESTVATFSRVGDLIRDDKSWNKDSSIETVSLNIGTF